MTFKAASLSDIYHGKGPWESCPLPVLVSQYHTILYELKSSLGELPEPHVPTEKLHWDEGYVRMPYSPRNVFPAKDTNGLDSLVSRWNLIQKAFQQDITSSKEFEAAVHSYNSRMPNFQTLHHICNEVFDENECERFFTFLLPGIVKLALDLPNILPGNVPFLRADHCKSLSFSQKQIACLLANAFLCTFPGRKSISLNYPSINFVSLFASSPNHNTLIEKIKCILHYFRRVLDKMPCGVVTFERQHISKSNMPRWDKLDNNLGNTRLYVDSEGTIEDNGLGLLQVDFANKFLGGGVLTYGSVQEEIRFVICPELIISRLFTEKLGHNESLIITGVERFSNYSGYGETFTWNGNFVDETPFDDYGRRRTSVVAIDATLFFKQHSQFSSRSILRELNKAYAGFYSRSTGTLPAVATGNWGCGAFGGNVHLKFLIQLMAASAARRDVAYYTFSSSKLTEEIYNMYTFLATNQITITQLWRLLCKFTTADLKPGNFFPFIQQAYFDSKKQPTIATAFIQLKAQIMRGNRDKKDSALSAQASLIVRPPRTENAKQESASSSKCNNNIESYDMSNAEVELPIEEFLTPEDEDTSIATSQISKRKRKTSTSASSQNIIALIDKIDGSKTSTKSSESGLNASIGFLEYVDEYSKQNQDKKHSPKDNCLKTVAANPEEEIAVDDILGAIAAERKEKKNIVTSSGKRKITDYFKKS